MVDQYLFETLFGNQENHGWEPRSNFKSISNKIWLTQNP